MPVDRTPPEDSMVELLSRSVSVPDLLVRFVRRMSGGELVGILPDVATLLALGYSDAVLAAALGDAAAREPEVVGGLVTDALVAFPGQQLAPGPVTDAARGALADFIAWDDALGRAEDYPASLAAVGAMLAAGAVT